jgi:hypothetical protein
MSSTPKKRNNETWVKLELGHDGHWHPVRDARGDILTCDSPIFAQMLIAQFATTMIVEEHMMTFVQDRFAKADALEYARQQRDEAEDAERKLLDRVDDLTRSHDELEEKLKYFQLPNRC